jgi:hypothetical protein
LMEVIRRWSATLNIHCAGAYQCRIYFQQFPIEQIHFMADPAIPDSVGFQQLIVRFESGDTEAYDGVSELLLREDDYIIRQGEGHIVIPRSSADKVTTGEDVDVKLE